MLNVKFFIDFLSIYVYFIVLIYLRSYYWFFKEYNSSSVRILWQELKNCWLFKLKVSILTGFSEKAFFFQRDNKLSNESRATLWLKPLPGGISEVTSFSFSLWFNVHYFRESTYAMSYAVSDEASNLLNLYLRKY